MNSGGLLTFLFASILVIGLTYVAARFVSTWQVMQMRGRRMKVLEGAPLGKDRNLLLVAVGKEILVVGSSPQGVSLVHRVEDPELVREILEQAAPEGPTQAPAVRLPGVAELLQRIIPKAQQPAGSEITGVESSIRGHLERMRRVAGKTGDGPHA